MRVRGCIAELTIIALFLIGMPLSVRLPAPVAASSGLGPLVTPWKAAPQSSSSRSAKLDAAYGRLSLAFEPNLGQAAPDVRFLAQGAELLGYAGIGALGLTADGSLVVRSAAQFKPAQGVA